MFNNIVETMIQGSNTIHIDINKEEFFFSYDKLNNTTAMDFIKNYFELKCRDGIPKIKNLELNTNNDRVRIIIYVDYTVNSNRTGYTVPDLIENANLSFNNLNE